MLGCTGLTSTPPLLLKAVLCGVVLLGVDPALQHTGLGGAWEDSRGHRMGWAIPGVAVWVASMRPLALAVPRVRARFVWAGSASSDTSMLSTSAWGGPWQTGFLRRPCGLV